MVKNIVVGRFSFPHEAQIARASLEAAGIPAFIADEHTINMNWLYSHALGGVRVMVAPEHEGVAREILATDYSADVDEAFGIEEPACPECGATSVTPYTKGKRPAFIVFLLLGFPLFFYQHGLKCEKCGTFWKT